MPTAAWAGDGFSDTAATQATARAVRAVFKTTVLSASGGGSLPLIDAQGEKLKGTGEFAPATKLPPGTLDGFAGLEQDASLEGE